MASLKAAPDTRVKCSSKVRCATLNPEPMDIYVYDGADNAFDNWNDDDTHDWFVPFDVPNPASDQHLEQLQALSSQVLELKTMFTTERAARMISWLTRLNSSNLTPSSMRKLELSPNNQILTHALTTKSSRTRCCKSRARSR